MTIYSESDRETLRARRLLKEWTGDGLITAEQYQRLGQETVSELRITNIFLRLVLFLFTVLGVIAAVALFFRIFLLGASQSTTGVFFLFFAVACYAAAEIGVAKFQLYRHGIEEALTVCSIAFLYEGLQFAFFSTHTYPPHGIEFLVPAAAALWSLWIWHRFDLWYAFPAAMVFAGFLPGYWTSSRSGHIVIVSVLYAAGLIGMAGTRSRRRSDRFDDPCSLAEAFLWMGIYLELNLRIDALDLPTHWWGAAQTAQEFAGPFYWMTWVLIWCLPAVVLARGIRRKDRFVLAAGAVTAVLTFISNKPYLGWQRHTWDPMLLGLLLTAVAAFLRRWLADGPAGVRHGFTAASISHRDRQALNTASAVLGLLSPQSITPDLQTTSSDFHFGGGGSGGGGASGDF